MYNNILGIWRLTGRVYLDLKAQWIRTRTPHIQIGVLLWRAFAYGLPGSFQTPPR